MNFEISILSLYGHFLGVVNTAPRMHSCRSPQKRAPHVTHTYHIILTEASKHRHHVEEYGKAPDQGITPSNIENKHTHTQKEKGATGPSQPPHTPPKLSRQFENKHPVLPAHPSARSSTELYTLSHVRQTRYIIYRWITRSCIFLSVLHFRAGPACMCTICNNTGTKSNPGKHVLPVDSADRTTPTPQHQLHLHRNI